ncbi:Stk1 family PASTA domain-containing Ser/Thr kinase [Rhodoluna sp. KAS3]|uniref:Stk1 family PASTA domain-containing Ser/Thr kinase n=1 Tax=Rhodoluna sp. KAS3 TaxID=942880 RepID=UPI00222F63E5|nr:Stk1 family PASTA domain-containing Ser/Thr kinase [Rhodoluna sp. KAS3]BDS48908.1 serine/threonine protein kinase [Rhodoluna sp. KAS3]
MADLIGRLIGDRYQVLRIVASGGMATVYLAEDLRLQRKVALKAIHPHLANDLEFREKFIREARMAARLSHPNLINVFDQGEDGEIAYMVMEFVAGINLRDAINDFGAIDPARALELFETVLAGLAAAHRGGILHRDLKPENIFLADDGRIKLGDFGLARDIDNATSTGSLVGTVAYLSPELITRGTADARSDVYAAGIILFEMLTGSQPFKGEQAVQIAYQHAHLSVPAPSTLNPKVGPLVDEIVLWATAREAAHRPVDAGELLEVVKRARTELKAGNQTIRLTPDRPVDLNSATTVLPTDAIDPDATQIFAAGNLAGNETAVLSELGQTQVLGSELAAADSLTPAADSGLVKLGRKRRGLRLALATVLIVLLGSGAGWWFSSGPGGFATVPELTSRTLEQAEVALSAIGAEFEVMTETSDSVAAGLVTRTDPPSGALHFGGVIKLYVSEGKRMVAAPEITGLNVAEATAALIKAELRIGAVSSWFDNATIGQIFASSLDGKSEVEVGTAVDVKISLGPIPVVAGLDKAVAVAAIEAVGLSVSTTSEEFSDTVSAGQVISLVPEADALTTGGKVTLIISKGPDLVAVPAVVGETILAAQGALESSGFKVTIDTNQLSSKWGVVTVKRVSHPAGTLLKRGSTVTIYSR